VPPTEATESRTATGGGHGGCAHSPHPPILSHAQETSDSHSTVLLGPFIGVPRMVSPVTCKHSPCRSNLKQVCRIAGWRSQKTETSSHIFEAVPSRCRCSYLRGARF
jgi:hypothetical protein